MTGRNVIWPVTDQVFNTLRVRAALKRRALHRTDKRDGPVLLLLPHCDGIHTVRRYGGPHPVVSIEDFDALLDSLPT